MTLGLHKRNLDHGSYQESRRAFWVVYCLEKEYAFNSSNASVCHIGSLEKVIC
jgi:hypothetical protein